MTRRHVGSLLIGVIMGLAAGVFLGWQQFPVEYTNSSLSALAPHYQEEYTVMVAEGYQYDQDLDGALSRLQPLGMENIFRYIRELTERYISQSNVPAIPPLVALADALSSEPLPPAMEIYHSTPSPSSP
ncbi:MAG: hypothetical protein JXQ72_09735 [Anaerolineae bacterium]|nr:hypothetical protein [Anaerolineae bacterium]